MKRKCFLYFQRGVFFLLLLSLFNPFTTQRVVKADGFVGFEEGSDRAAISDSVPGLHFSNTNGHDWIYGDWQTGQYNGKYPNGAYTSNGNVFAWLGEAQGDGRIDFTNADATYVSLWVSCAEAVTLTGYDINGAVLDSQTIEMNLNTGRMDNLTVRAPSGKKLSYAVVSGVANFWLIDDLSTDAGGVPERPPLILIPGVAGSFLVNDENLDGSYSEIWPNVSGLIFSNDDAFLRDLRLSIDGSSPYDNQPQYTSVQVGDIIRSAIQDVYQPTIQYFTEKNGYKENETFFVCPYDWRKDLRDIAAGSLNKTLDLCIQNALDKNPGSTKVNLLAHSMGGLISKIYISDANRAAKVDTLVTLGTPYLGAPKVAQIVLDKGCFIDPYGFCITSPDMAHEITQNFPSAYELAPSTDYYQVYPDGYYRRERDTNNNGEWDGNLNYSQLSDLFRQHNSTVTGKMETVHNMLAGGWKDHLNGVKVYMIVGDQQSTIGTIVEYEKAPWYNPWGTKSTAYRVEMTNGDGTVPLHSGDMKNTSRGVDLTGNVSVFYFKAEHGDLPKRIEILQLAGDIFSSSGNQFAAWNVPQQESQVQPQSLSPNGIVQVPGKMTTLAVEAPRTEPLPLNGSLISVDGPANLKVVDSQGNTVGYPFDGNSNADKIPNATVEKVGNTTYVFISDPDVYHLEILGQQQATADIRIENIQTDTVIQTTLYDDVALTGNSTAVVNFTPYGTVPGDLQLDLNGDLQFEESISPTILDEQQSKDTVPPNTFIQLEGTKTSHGWYTGMVEVTLIANDNDNGTGIAKVEYSLDGGNTVLLYNGQPFMVDAKQVKLVMAKATDVAGNEEPELVLASVGPNQIYIPVTIR